MSPFDHALLLNLIVLGVVLEADLGGHRKIGWFRILRPIVTAGAIIPSVISSPATSGTGLVVEFAGLLLGLLGGLLATASTGVYRSPRTGRPVSRTGLGYVAVWVTAIGARVAFSYGSVHWFGAQLDRWLTVHHVTGSALTDAIIAMALTMLVTRTAALAVRAARTPQTPIHLPRSTAGAPLAQLVE